ncbi:cyclic nucleotide-binding domain-containing protein [Desulfococcaceae bacterium HSG7]|nr:cyclic nucleotide-binding domain-containing protein [Desulfococcaceae bacterium HSG7]
MPDSYKDITELVYRLSGLTKTGAVLHLGAHPDDEDIGLLAYLTCKHCVRTVYWSATRGEGGQNRIGTYKGEALGVFRTWETLNARCIDRAEALYGPFIDFDYCKDSVEVFDKWGKERLVMEIVRAIRMVQPQIVISRWRGDSGDFHGQHQAVGKAADIAFRAAADKNRFPELNAQGLPPWQPAKFYTSLDNAPEGASIVAMNLSGGRNSKLENQGALRINTGAFDPIAGCSFQQRAWLAYNQNKTQAMGLAPAPGDFYYYLELKKSRAPVLNRESDIFEGLDNTLTGLSEYCGNEIQGLETNLDQVKAMVSQSLNTCRLNDPMQAADSLLEAMEILKRVRSDLASSSLDQLQIKALDFYFERKINEFQKAAAQCLGLVFECLSDTERVTPGQTFHTRTNLWNHRNHPLKEVDISLKTPTSWKIKLEATASEDSSSVHMCKKHTLVTPETEELSCPYWLKRPYGPYHYDFENDISAGLPFCPSLIAAECKIRLGNHEIRLQTDAVSRKSFPGGNRELAISVIPPLSIFPKDPHEFLPVKAEPQELKLEVSVISNVNEAISGILMLHHPPSFEVEPPSVHFDFAQYNTLKRAKFKVTIPADASPGNYPLRYTVLCNNREYDVIHEPVRSGAPGIPGPPDRSNCVREKFITKPARVNLGMHDVKFIRKQKYAYVTGEDENIVKALRNFDLDFHLFPMLSDRDLDHEKLKEFNAVIVGPNAYLVKEGLRQNAQMFLDYVADGGTLIVQYQGYGYEGKGFTPYPFSYSRPHDRVTDEDSQVTILDPQHHLFNLPNHITEADFDNWFRDRGLYFFGEWDKRYTPLLSCSDPGEPAKQGGMLITGYGRGIFMYTGYSFFRQLPAGTAGAFRLFANILALPAVRILNRAEFIRSVPLFSFMSKDDLQEIAGIIKEKMLEDGDYLCHQGDQSNEMYIIVKGEVEIFREADGRRRGITVCLKGEVIGEMAVLGDMPRSASMIAKGNALLYVIDSELFKTLMHSHPAMYDKVIKMLVRKLAA